MRYRKFEYLHVIFRVLVLTLNLHDSRDAARRAGPSATTDDCGFVGRVHNDEN